MSIFTYNQLRALGYDGCINDMLFRKAQDDIKAAAEAAAKLVKVEA